MKRFVIAAVCCAIAVSLAVGVSGCDVVGGVINQRHAILAVGFGSAMHGDMDVKPEMDDVLLRNVLDKGGAVVCGSDHEYIEFLRKFDPYFELTAALNKNREYNIKHSILNWIASKGWKLQQVVVPPSFKGGYTELYYFVK